MQVSGKNLSLSGTSDTAELHNDMQHTGARLARRSGLTAWLRSLLPGANRTPSTQLERIRNAMLQELAQLPNVETSATEEPAKSAQAAQSAKSRHLVATQIAESSDAEILWRLRSNLAQALGTSYSPIVVHQRMAEISFMFAGLLHHRAPRPGDNVVQLPTRPGPQHHLPTDRPTPPSSWHQI